MISPVTAQDLLALCTMRLDVNGTATGTALVVAPRYAVATAHQVNGRRRTEVALCSRTGDTMLGHIEDVRPPARSVPAVRSSTYPPPDLALIRLQAEAPICALLAGQRPALNSEVVAYGYTCTFDACSVTAESEAFVLSGELETTLPGFTLIKLGHGQAIQGMSGAPVLGVSSGKVIGLLRTSRDGGSGNLGAWVIPADLIRQQWPEQVAAGHDSFHSRDDRWRRVSSDITAAEGPSRPAGAPPASQIGSIVGGAAPTSVIIQSSFRDITVSGSPVLPPGGSLPVDGADG